MPVLVLTVAEYFDELLQNGVLTAITALRESCRVVIVAVDIALVLVVAVLGAEYCRAHGAGEMLDMILPIQRSDV